MFCILGFFALGNLTSPIEHTLRSSDVLLSYALLSQLPSSLVTLDTQNDYIHLMLGLCSFAPMIVVAIIAAKMSAENIKSNRLSNLLICSHGHKAVEYALLSLHFPLLLLALNGAPLHSA